MDTNTYQLTFPAFVLLVAGIAWFLFQRQVKKSDDEAAKDAQVIDERLKTHGQRIGEIENRCHKVELEMSSKVSREELDKIYDKIDEVRRDFKEDLKDLKTDLIAAFKEGK